MKNLRTLSIPGSDIPDWFAPDVASVSKGENLVIKAVMIGVVVSINHHTGDELREGPSSLQGVKAKIIRMKREEFEIDLVPTGMSKTDEDNLYLIRYSQFDLLVSKLKDRDQIQVAMANPPMIRGLELKKSGIHLIFGNDDDYDEDEGSLDDSLHTVSGKIARFFGSSEEGM